ncbi:MAG: hypothetical protein GXO46_07030 [Chlorobi bacterium]|nr:hypothetical protein [Chlorobiota bacterium]
MKKTYFKLSLLMIFLSFLWSCRQELLQTEQDYNVQSQNITVQRLSREELQLQHPDVMQKVENLVSKKHSAKGIYTDAENGFSIDTDVAVYIQDRYGNKTYTFEAVTDKKDSRVLQNIVLKDLGDGTFSVWMANYDQELLSNREQTSTEFLKQYLTVDNLGDKKGSDIFGKASLCFTPIAVYEYIPAIPCSSPEHHTNPAACDCGKPGHDCIPPTASSYQFVYYIGTFDCTGGSSGNTGNDGSTTGGTTLPVGSGSGGNTVASPCSKVKKPFTKIPTLAQKAESFATYTSDNVEHGFTVMSDANANTPNPYTEYTGVAGGVNVPTTPPSPYMIFVHTHNSPTNSTYSVPSWYDL